MTTSLEANNLSLGVLISLVSQKLDSSLKWSTNFDAMNFALICSLYPFTSVFVFQRSVKRDDDSLNRCSEDRWANCWSFSISEKRASAICTEKMDGYYANKCIKFTNYCPLYEIFRILQSLWVLSHNVAWRLQFESAQSFLRNKSMLEAVDDCHDIDRTVSIFAQGRYLCICVYMKDA